MKSVIEQVGHGRWRFEIKFPPDSRLNEEENKIAHSVSLCINLLIAEGRWSFTLDEAAAEMGGDLLGPLSPDKQELVAQALADAYCKVGWDVSLEGFHFTIVRPCHNLRVAQLFAEFDIFLRMIAADMSRLQHSGIPEVAMAMSRAILMLSLGSLTKKEVEEVRWATRGLYQVENQQTTE